MYLCVSLSLLFSTSEYSWSQQELRAVNPVTPVICLSSAQAAVPTALPTSTCTTATPASTLMATVTTAFARPMSSSVSRCGAKVCVRRTVEGLHTGPVWLLKAQKLIQALKGFFYCVCQEPSQPQGSALKGSTQQGTRMATVARIQRAPLQNVKHGESWCSCRNQSTPLVLIFRMI